VREALPETREHGVYALLAIGYPATERAIRRIFIPSGSLSRR
jgi:hypothetical protein